MTPEDKELVYIRFQELGQAIENVKTALVGALTPLMEAAAEAAHQMYTRLQELYADAGRPYGDDRAGLMRWVEEELERLQKRKEQEP